MRDGAYYKHFSNDPPSIQKLNSETGADCNFRNPRIQGYIPMLKRCASSGLTVLRMGHTVSDSLPPDLPSNIIDYSSLHRTAFGDIYLCAHCKFLVAGGTGMWKLATAFNRPIILTDSYCLQYKPYRSSDIILPLLYWVKKEKRFLTFREMIDAYLYYSYESTCQRHDIEIVHNAPDDIMDGVDEMNQRIDGVWVSSEDDEDLQRR